MNHVILNIVTKKELKQNTYVVIAKEKRKLIQMGDNRVCNNRQNILDFLYENQNQTFSPIILSSILNIPNSSVRNELANLLYGKMVEKYDNPFGIGHLDYYTNDIILDKHLDTVKKEQRKINCKKYDQTYREKKRRALK